MWDEPWIWLIPTALLITFCEYIFCLSIADLQYCGKKNCIHYENPNRIQLSQGMRRIKLRLRNFQKICCRAAANCRTFLTGTSKNNCKFRQINLFTGSMVFLDGFLGHDNEERFYVLAFAIIFMLMVTMGPFFEYMNSK